MFEWSDQIFMCERERMAVMKPRGINQVPLGAALLCWFRTSQLFDSSASLLLSDPAVLSNTLSIFTFNVNQETAFFFAQKTRREGQLDYGVGRMCQQVAAKVGGEIAKIENIYLLVISLAATVLFYFCNRTINCHNSNVLCLMSAE